VSKALEEARATISNEVEGNTDGGDDDDAGFVPTVAVALAGIAGGVALFANM
jgi:hypothetical protein